MTGVPLELTLAMIKPHAIKIPPTLQGIRRIILSEFLIVQSKRMSMTTNMAEEFYSEHKDKFFYTRLINSMTSGPSDILVLARENAILKWRELMGPTKVFKAKITHPETIRGKYGITDTRNVTHGSDSTKSVAREAKMFFPEFNIDEWYQIDEPHYRNNNVIFNAGCFVHRIK